MTGRRVRVLVRRSATGVAPADLRVVDGRWDVAEPLYGAALRVLRDTGLDRLEPWAVDLSGAVPLLAADAPDHLGMDLPAAAPADDAESARWARVAATPLTSFGFRPMTRADFPDVARWTTSPHVARWWDDEAVDVASAERHYGPALDGTDPTRMWVVEANGRSIGFVQDYRIGDHPEFALLTGHPDAIGFDYAIGEPAWVGRGSGTRMLWEYLRDVVRPHYRDASAYFAAPDHRNTVSLRVLDKLGFTRGLWFDEPQRGGGVATVVGCTMDVPAVLGADPRQVTDR